MRLQKEALFESVTITCFLLLLLYPAANRDNLYQKAMKLRKLISNTNLLHLLQSISLECRWSEILHKWQGNPEITVKGSTVKGLATDVLTHACLNAHIHIHHANINNRNTHHTCSFSILGS